MSALHPDLLAAFELARTAPAPFVHAIASDADGTLWEGDVGDALFLELSAHDAFTPESRALLEQTARAHNVPIATDTRALVDTLMARYADGTIPVDAMCALQARCAGDRSLTEFNEWIDRVCTHMLPRVRPEVARLLDHAQREGYPLHVVTGSLGAVVSALLTRAGIAFQSVSGVELERTDTRVLCTERTPAPLHEGKNTALRTQNAWPCALGMGDGHWDAPFLRAVHVPLLIEPKPALHRAMEGHPNLRLFQPRAGTAG